MNFARQNCLSKCIKLYFLEKKYLKNHVCLGQNFLLVDLREFFFRFKVGGTKKNK